MKEINYKFDGIDHINIYSKGKTKLGQFLSNFYHQEIETVDGTFQSVEGYWYWLNSPPEEREQLRDLYGWEAKKVGKEIGKDWNKDPVFKTKILYAIMNKLCNSEYLQEFCDSKLEFRHYYVFKDDIFEPKESWWLVDFFTELRRIAQGYKVEPRDWSPTNVEDEVVDISDYEYLNLDEKETIKFEYLVKQLVNHQRYYYEFDAQRQLNFLVDKIIHNTEWIDYAIKMGPVHINNLRRDNIKSHKTRTPEDDTTWARINHSKNKGKYHICWMCDPENTEQRAQREQEDLEEILRKLGVE